MDRSGNVQLAGLLALANSSVSIIWRTEFYALKDRLLKEYGTPAGRDIQHIVKECWDCNGSGFITRELAAFGEPWKHTHKCMKCIGHPGVYDEFWVELERYQIGAVVLHIPRGRLYRAPITMEGVNALMEGYVKHTRSAGHLSSEAALKLFWLYDRNVFWKKLGHIGFHKAVTPFCILSSILFTFRQFPKDVKWRIWNIKNWIRQIKMAFWDIQSTQDDDRIPF